MPSELGGTKCTKKKRTTSVQEILTLKYVTVAGVPHFCTPPVQNPLTVTTSLRCTQIWCIYILLSPTPLTTPSLEHPELLVRLKIWIIEARKDTIQTTLPKESHIIKCQNSMKHRHTSNKWYLPSASIAAEKSAFSSLSIHGSGACMLMGASGWPLATPVESLGVLVAPYIEINEFS